MSWLGRTTILRKGLSGLASSCCNVGMRTKIVLDVIAWDCTIDSVMRNRFALQFLNVAQFFAVLNDNLFKFLTIYLLIDLQGKEASSDILFWVGVCFVLPFLLFSAAGGVLADRFSKQRLVIILKASELFIACGGIIAYSYESVMGCYATLFVLCLHSAFLSPAKYSMIPELVPREQIPKANGIITSSSYLAMIVGTFVASFLTQVTGRNFVLAVSVCVVTALIGFIASLYLPYTQPARSSQKLSPFFVAQTLRTLTFCKKTSRLFLAVIGSAFFLFIGAFLQLNIIPFAMDFLSLSEVGGGYLFLGTAIGIAAGATFAGRLCKKEIDLGLSCFSLLILSLALFSLPLMRHSLVGTAITLVILGIFSGLFIVPLEAYIQSFTPLDMRGQVVAAENFLGFLGVLLAPLSLFFFGKIAHISSAAGFSCIALVIFAVFILMTHELGGQFAHFLARRFVHPFYKLHFIGYPFGPNYQEDRFAITMKGTSLRNVAFLLGESPRLTLYLITETTAWWHKMIRLFANIRIASALPETCPDRLPVFLFTTEALYQTFLYDGSSHRLSETHPIRHFAIKHTSHFTPPLTDLFRRTQVTLSFTAHTKKGG